MKTNIIHKEDLWGDDNIPDKIIVSDLNDIIEKINKEPNDRKRKNNKKY